MIKINGFEIGVNHFPDGTQMLLNVPTYYIFDSVSRSDTTKKPMNIYWNYERDEELVTLYFLLKHLREKIHIEGLQYRLFMPYVPNARMDRTKSSDEVFTLKYFCQFINDLKFDIVYVLDPHSNVTEALIDNVCINNIEPYIKYALEDVEGFGIDGGKKYGGSTVVYFPDAGAMKRYGGLSVFGNREFIYGAKERDWKTGKINGLKVLNRDGEPITDENALKGKTVLMIDDIVSYGGTLAYSADALRKLGASAVYAYVTHTENSVLDKEKGTLLNRLESGVVDELFTTNSIYRGNHDRITIVSPYDGE